MNRFLALNGSNSAGLVRREFRGRESTACVRRHVMRWIDWQRSWKIAPRVCESKGIRTTADSHLRIRFQLGALDFRAAELIRVFVGAQIGSGAAFRSGYAEFHRLPRTIQRLKGAHRAWILWCSSAAYFCTKFAANREVVSQLETVFDFITFLAIYFSFIILPIDTYEVSPYSRTPFQICFE